MLPLLDISDPLTNAVNKLKDAAMNIGTPVILFAGVIVCMLCILVGLFLMKKSMKAAASSWGIALVAIIVSVAWTVIKTIAQNTGNEAKNSDWNTLPIWAVLVVVLLFVSMKNRKNVNE